MAVTVWSQQRVDGGIKREQMAVTMWFQQRVDGNHSVESRENR